MSMFSVVAKSDMVGEVRQRSSARILDYDHSLQTAATLRLQLVQECPDKCRLTRLDCPPTMRMFWRAEIAYRNARRWPRAGALPFCPRTSGGSTSRGSHCAYSRPA